MRTLIKITLLVLFFVTSKAIIAQDIQYSRAGDKGGINVFEPSKVDNVTYEGFKINIGGNFRQSYQLLSHENVDTSAAKVNALYALGNGFGLAAANLNFNVQLDDGIRVYLENYMASRHHNEFWVKGGFIQIDKLPMFNNPEWFTKYVRVKIGHMEVNYGDSHFRRMDNGNAIYNPFAGNNIMDEFATEIGGEVYIYPTEGLMLMAGLTNGLIKNNVADYSGATSGVTSKNPSILLKGAYDKNVNDDLRFRLSASLYTNSSSPGLTLFGGDRTGSAYEGVLEKAAATNGTGESFSGRFNPGMRNSLTAIMINPFVKYQGIEFFGTYETASGKNAAETDDRTTSQLAGELVYRFLANEQLFVAAKYNKVTSRLAGYTTDVTIDRTSFSAGWFPTKNLLLKTEVVNQAYDGFKGNDIRNGGKFNGVVVQAVVGF